MSESTRNAVFRVDSSLEIGHGHLMRCLVIAEELRSRGVNTFFICRSHQGSAHERVKDAGHKLHLLVGKQKIEVSEDYESWLGCDQADDARECNLFLEQFNSCSMIVDHYALDSAWESQAIYDRLFVLDDLANRKHEPCVLIDQSLINRREAYAGIISGQFKFYGNQNIVLRREFRNHPGWSDSTIKSILVCMGGTDPRLHTLDIVKSLLNLSDACEFIDRLDIIIGSAFRGDKFLSEILSDAPFEVRVYRTHSSISDAISGASVSILSCGSMILEACALGAPSIGVAVAENQQPTGEYLAEQGAIVFLDSNMDLGSEVKKLLMGKQCCYSLSAKSKAMVNKSFVEELAEEIAR